MTTCDLCHKKTDKFNLTVLHLKYQQPGIKEICRECNRELDDAIIIVDRYKAWRKLWAVEEAIDNIKARNNHG